MRPMLVLVLAMMTSSACLAGTSADPPAPDAAARPAVLVTGASAGIGRKITEKLAASGFHVFAGARKPTDLEALDALPNVTAVRLDVNSPADVARAVETVRGSGHALYGLVNNAGVAIIDPVVSTKDEDFDFQMQANVYGVFRVTKAFAPLVIEARGRILNVSSISAFLSDPHTAAYTMSKMAVEGFTNVLASELAPAGVAVIGIEPGAYNTDILKPALARSNTKGFSADRSTMKPPDEVATAVLLALTEPRPKRRYMVVPEQAQAEETIRGALEMAVQLNADQPYAYDRAAMIRLLDESLSKARAEHKEPNP
jgi:NAD(P)-dependent dehydrogenase (short-subunit alcohol dehydrogenase family)